MEPPELEIYLPLPLDVESGAQFPGNSFIVPDRRFSFKVTGQPLPFFSSVKGGVGSEGIEPPTNSV